MLMGVLAVSVRGNGAVEIVTEVGLNAGASVQVVVFEVAGGQEVVPSVNVVVELFRIVAEAFAKVIIMLLNVPASALVFARSSFRTAPSRALQSNARNLNRKRNNG
jgi:hypothetical protein